MNDEEKKEIIGRVWSIMAEDIDDVLEGSKITGNGGSLLATVHTTAQVKDAIRLLGKSLQRAVDQGSELEDWF